MLTSTRLFGDGKHGQAERIQTFRCQSCRTTFTARRHTPLYRLKTPLAADRSGADLALAEGLDLSEASRVFGYRQATITSLSDSRWGTCTDLARALLPQPTDFPSSVRRATHQAAQRQAGAVALASHRSLHQDSSRAPSRSPHAKHGPSAHPLPARTLGS